MTPGRITQCFILVSCLAGAAAAAAASAGAAADKFENSVYLRLGLGSRLFPMNDVNRQFDASSVGGLKPQAPDQWAFNGDLSVGYQSASLFGLELGLSGGRGLESFISPSSNSYYYNYSYYNDFNATFKNSASGGYDSQEYFSIATFYLMPVLRLPSAGLFGKNFFQTLGLQLGTSSLTGYTSSMYYYGSYGSYGNFRAQAFCYGLNYRIEQMLGKRVSLGLDLGYVFANYSPTYTNGTAMTRMDGSPLTFDFSGPSIKLSLGIWILRPFINPAEDLAEKELREKRIRERQRRRRGGDLDSEVNAKLALRLQKKADLQMEQKNYAVASELFQECVDSDLSSRWCWQGLGNANYYLGKKEQAQRAYEKAYVLSDNDERLKNMIERIKKELLNTPLTQTAP